MKNPGNHTSRIAAAFLVLACCASFTVTAAKASPAKDLLMSFNENFTSNSTLDGTVTLTGAISVRGTIHHDITVDSVNNDGSQVVVSGTGTITASDGTITTQYRGTIYFDNATFDSTHLAYIEGVQSVTGGTGAYAGVTGRGHGTFEGTIDYDANGCPGNFVGVFETKV